MSGHGVSDIKSEPDLTPMLDMVFQLMTFFMLVASFKQAELDTTFQLPILGSAAPVKAENKKMLVLNIRCVDSRGEPVEGPGGKPQLTMYGNAVPADQIDNIIAVQAQTSILSPSTTRIEDDKKYPNECVVIRAHQWCPFGFLSNLITSCQKAGYRDFAFKVAKGKNESK